MQIYQGEPLNILHTIGMKTRYPIIRVHFKINGILDLNHFKMSVMQLKTVIPELFCKYRLSDNSFIPVTDNADDILFQDINPDQDCSDWDLFKDPQWRIYLNRINNGYDVTIFLSHILTDGAGAKQLLALLSKAYNTGHLNGIHNHNDIGWLKDLLKEHSVKVDKVVDHPAHPLTLPKLVEKTKQQRRTGKVTLSRSFTQSLISASHYQKVTLNDLFMAAFGTSVQRYDKNNHIALTCPADMRKFIQGPTQWRVANHTSRYNINVKVSSNQPFEKTVQDVHQAMYTNKRNFQCLASIKTLVEHYEQGTLNQLQQAAEDNYHVRPISYTNLGIIDDKKFKFNNCTINDFDMVGCYRPMPMFQSAISTFKGQVILAYAMIGTPEEERLGHAVTCTMADLLKNYALKYA